MYAYSLTGMTGKKRNEGRMMVVATVEVNRHFLAVSAISLIAGLVVAMPFALISGYAFLIFPVISVPLGNALFRGHQRRGLQVSRFSRLLNKRRGAQGFIINGTEFDEPGFVLHVPVVIDTPDVDAREPGENSWSSGDGRRAPVIGKAKRSSERTKVSAAHAFS